MALTVAQLEAQLTLVQTAITAALANPLPNYKVGDTSYDHADYIKMLFNTQKQLKDMIQEVPAEAVGTLQDGVNVIGEDLADYKNEPRY